MALKYEIDTTDGIDEAVAGLYKEADGKFVLDVEGVVPQSDYAKANQKAIDAAEEAKRRRGTVERVTGLLGLETADGLDDAIRELMAGKGKSKQADEEIAAQLREQYEAKLADKDKRFNAVLIDGAQAKAQAALVEAGFPPKVAEMLSKTSRNRLSVDETENVRILSAEGKPLAGSGGDGYATFGDLAKELAADMPDLLLDRGKGGGGKPPASDGQGGQKTVTRSQFDSMSQYERAEFSKSGGKVVD